MVVVVVNDGRLGISAHAPCFGTSARPRLRLPLRRFRRGRGRRGRCSQGAGIVRRRAVAGGALRRQKEEEEHEKNVAVAAAFFLE